MVFTQESDLASNCEGQGDDRKTEAEAKAERIRKKVYQEIVGSEKTYLSQLQLVVQCFENPLREKKILADHVIVTIFSNIRHIIAINEELLQHLQTGGVGEAFMRISPFLKLYSTYANNHERALSALIEWDQKNAEFAAWRRAQEDLPQVKGLKLNALLITPVQRIPRYRLLLEELLQNTSVSCSTYQKIEEAKKQVSEVAEHINEHMKQHDNFMKMIAIQRSLTGHSAPRILVPGRIFIKEGALKKVSKKGGRSRERMFFLFSDMLMYTKPKWVENRSIGGYSCCCIMPLHHCKVSRVFGHSQGAGALFNISCKEESLLLYSDQKTVDSWMETLEKAISAFQARRQTLKKPSSAKKPMRGPALVKLRKKEKESDPLGQLRSSPARSPNVKKAQQDCNWPCLSPRTESVSVADVALSDHPPRQRILSCFTPRTDSFNSSESVVSRSIKRLVGDGNELVGNRKLEKSQKQRLFSCITPRTESFTPADIVVMPIVENNPDTAAATSTKSNPGILSSLLPKQLFKRSLRKRKSKEEPKTPSKEKERRREPGVTFGSVVESPAMVIEEDEDEEECDSPVTIQYSQQFNTRRPLSTITEMSELSRMSKWAHQKVYEDDSEEGSSDEEDNEIDGPVKIVANLDDADSDDESVQNEENRNEDLDDLKVKEDIWQWHMERQEHLNNSLRPPDDPLHQIHISPSSLDQGCCTNFNYRK